MKGVERAEGGRKGFASAGEDRTLKEDEVDRLQPLGDCRPPGGCLFRRERPLQPEAVHSSQAFDRQELTRHKGLARKQLFPSSRLSEHEAEKRGSVEVRDHLDARSWSRTVRLFVGLEGRGGRSRSLGLRVALLTSRGSSAPNGTILATGVSRSRTVSV
jgi:hypothetical protein